MSVLVRSHTVRTLVALAVLLAGCSVGSNAVIAGSIVLFLALAVERWAEVVRERGGSR